MHISKHKLLGPSVALFEVWLERRHGVLTYHLPQVLTGHGCFRRFLLDSSRRFARVSPLCGPPGGYGGRVPRLGGAPPCPRGSDRRRWPLAPGPRGKPGGVGSRHFLLQNSNTSEGGASAAARGDAQCDRRRATISSHRRRGFVGDEQRVARRPIRTEPMSTALCVPRVPQGAVSTHWRGQIDIGPKVCRGHGIRSNETPRRQLHLARWHLGNLRNIHCF